MNRHKKGEGTDKSTFSLILYYKKIKLNDISCTGIVYKRNVYVSLLIFSFFAFECNGAAKDG